MGVISSYPDGTDFAPARILDGGAFGGGGAVGAGGDQRRGGDSQRGRAAGVASAFAAPGTAAAGAGVYQSGRVWLRHRSGFVSQPAVVSPSFLRRPHDGGSGRRRGPLGDRAGRGPFGF